MSLNALPTAPISSPPGFATRYARSPGESRSAESRTVIGPDVLEADRFATAPFAMGRTGVTFIELLPGLETYRIDRAGRATMTSHFPDYAGDAHA